MPRYFVPFAAVAATTLTCAASPHNLACAQTAPAASSRAVLSASAPMVGLAATDAQTLASALRSIARQTGVAFVAEGTPFRARGSTPPLVALAEKWPANGLPLDEAVQKIVGAYDYDAERKGDVFLLRKRYTNPNDLPEVTTEELRLALRDASRAASTLPAPTVPPVDNDEPNTPFAAAFFRSLPSEARAKIAEPPSDIEIDSNGLVMIATPNFISIPISKLNPQQKNSLWQCAVDRYIQFATGSALRGYKALQTVERNGMEFGLTVTKEATGKIEKSTVFYTPKREESAVFPAFAPKGEVDEAAPVSADYAPDGSVLSFNVEAEGVETQTLGSLRYLSKDPALFTVDACLEKKRVLAVLPASVSRDNALKETVFRAAGATYGLRVFHGKADAWRIARDRAQTPKEFSALNAAVLVAFPEPLLRAFNRQFAYAEAKALAYYMKRDENNPDYDPKESSFAEKISAKSSGLEDTRRALREAALHRFRVLVEPSLAPEKTVLYSDFSVEARRLFTLAIVTDCLIDMAKLRDDQLPPTRAAMETGYLMGALVIPPKADAVKAFDHKFQFAVTFSGENNSSKTSIYTIGNVTVPIPPAKAE